MTVSTDAATTAKLAGVFDAPSKEAMLALDWSEFEDFVALVFESAGYAVEKVSPRPRNNVDLILHAGHVGGRILARVEVRRYSTANIIRARVHQFYGALVQKGNAPGYIVTTSDFTKPAYEAAASYGGKVKLINGERFLRYIRYVRGTRVLNEGGQTSDIPQPTIAPDLLLEAEAIPRRSVTQTAVLAVANNKGGVAKTTTALNLALVLTLRHHQRVLLVDCDGQGSLTELLPQPLPKPERGRRHVTEPPPTPPTPPRDTAFLSDYFLDRTSLKALVRPTRFDGLWLIPADSRLTQLDGNGSLLTNKTLAFIHDLHSPSLVAPDGQDFDWILLDTPPAQALCTRSAVAASHYVVLPAMAETLAARGARGGLATSFTMRQLSGKGAEVLGCVITRYRQNPQTDQALIGLRDLLRQNGSHVFMTKVPEDTRIERGNASIAEGGLRHLFRIALGPAARAYEALVKEVLPYVQRSDA